MKLGTLSGLFLAGCFVSSLCLAGGVASADDQSSSEVLAVVNGHNITRGELEQHSTDNMARARAQVVQAQMAFYNAESSALQELIDKEVLTQEGAKQHVTGDELLKRETEGKVKEPSEETLRVYYLGSGTKEPYEAVRTRIRNSIIALENKHIADQYLEGLRAKDTVKITLLPPHREVAVGDNPLLGPVDAPVTVVEFADYQCPYCRQEEPVMQKLREQFKDKVKISYRDFPLPMHQYARKAAEAARCAGEQGKFWPYHDKIFSAGGEDLGVPALKTAARDLKLDGAKFDKCVDSSQEQAAVDKDLNAGKNLGITGTPTIYVNGFSLAGAQPYAALESVVQEQIAAAQQQNQQKKAGNAASNKPQANAGSKGSSQVAGN